MLQKLKPSQVRVGMTFNRLTVTHLYREEKPCPSASTGLRTWCMADAKCSCGRVKVGILVGHLASGRTESCGSCGLNKERSIEANTTHGLCNNPLYDTIWDMNDRCKNPNNEYFEDYGGDGISIEYLPWDRDAYSDGYVQAFVDWNASLPKDKQWRPGLTIDRIDNDRGYYPANCRWTSRKRQQRNQRRTIMRRFRCRETPIADIFDAGKREGFILAEISYQCFKNRIKSGWTLQQACKTPLDKAQSARASSVNR